MGFSSQRDIQIPRPENEGREGKGTNFLKDGHSASATREVFARKDGLEFVGAVKCESGPIKIVLLAEKAEGMLRARARKARNGEVTRSDGGEWEPCRTRVRKPIVIGLLNDRQ